jgi:hypothetical protein
VWPDLSYLPGAGCVFDSGIVVIPIIMQKLICQIKYCGAMMLIYQPERRVMGRAMKLMG